MLKKIKNLAVFSLFILSFVAYYPVAAANLEIKYSPQAFSAPASLNFEPLASATNLPWEWQLLGPAYDYSFSTAGFYDPSRPLELRLSYEAANSYYKQIFILDQLSGAWRPILSQDHPDERYVSALVTSTSGQVALLANPEILSIGQASWYKYKNGLFAASPDFLKGTVLKVTNLDNGKSVQVTVNDYGPDRARFPERAIDLDKVAFEKLASTGAGIIRVKVEPIKAIAASGLAKASQLQDQPSLTASSAVIVAADSGRVLWGKEADKAAPLASLTKLVAATVFLETKTSLDKVVSYKYQDEKYNYEYCKPWESARLRVKEGETMTVKDLLYSSLVGSANNAVESLVRASGLSRTAFIARMNELTKGWGATHTKFVEPTGLSPDNVSSPSDYAIIMKEVMKDSLLAKISATTKYTFSTINTKQPHTLRNTNQLLNTSQYKITGSKTGYLDEAGYCLATEVASEKGGLIVINFGSKSKADNFADNERLIKYGLKLLGN